MSATAGAATVAETDMATIEVGRGQNVTAQTGAGNTYDVSNGGVLQIAPQLDRDIDTTINLEGGGGLIIQAQLQGLDLSGLRFSGEGNVIAFENAANASAGLFGNQPLDLSASGFGSTDGFAFPGNDAISSETYDPVSGALELVINGARHSILVTPGLDPVDFHVASADGATGIAYIACFVRGTRIATPDGERAVEELHEGDLVRLAAGGTAPVRWIGRRRMRFATTAPHANSNTSSNAGGTSNTSAFAQPVAIAPGALAQGVPSRELRVSPDHALHLDGVLVPAGLLVNGASIRRLAVDTVEYLHVELDTHDILLAEGAPAETYLDTGNRGMFANAPIASLHPGSREASATSSEAIPTFAEMVFAGPVLDAIRARLDARATELDQSELRRAS